MIIVKYQTEEEKQQIIGEKVSQGYTLVEVANIKDGNFLGFMKEIIFTPIEEMQAQTLLNTELLLIYKELEMEVI
jgi:hypothetical protein